MTNMLNANIAETVFLAGVAKGSGRRVADDMIGVVTGIDQAAQQISVKWDHWAMAHQGPLRYGAEDFTRTTDRDGETVLVLDI